MAGNRKPGYPVLMGSSSKSIKPTQERRQLGFSSLEILITLTLLMIFMIGVLPTLNTFVARQDQMLTIDRLKNAIEFARQEAFQRNTTITLCASTTRNSCSAKTEWSSGFIVFENPERAWQPDEEKRILSYFPGTQYGRLYFTATGNQLHIQASGQTTNIGTFVYCAKQSSIKPKGLVINWAARSYSTEENPEKSKPLSAVCLQ